MLHLLLLLSPTQHANTPLNLNVFVQGDGTPLGDIPIGKLKILLIFS